MAAPRFTVGFNNNDVGVLDMDRRGLLMRSGDADRPRHVEWAHEDAAYFNEHPQYIVDYAWIEVNG